MVLVSNTDSKEIIEKVFAELYAKDYFEKIVGTQPRHISSRMEEYLAAINMTADEYNLVIDKLNVKYRKVLDEMRLKILSYADTDKLFRYVNRLGKQFGYVTDRFRTESYIDVMKEEKNMKIQIAARLSIMLVIENNSREMGYSNYQELCDYRNL